jgi:hypothetical protein
MQIKGKWRRPPLIFPIFPSFQRRQAFRRLPKPGVQWCKRLRLHDLEISKLVKISKGK